MNGYKITLIITGVIFLCTSIGKILYGPNFAWFGIRTRLVSSFFFFLFGTLIIYCTIHS